jgi:ubiquinone/menaquinone biosynthesis C-methylase UbiE
MVDRSQAHRHELADHYNRKYSKKCCGNSEKVLPEITYPHDRFQAVCHFFPKYFKGSNIIEFGAGDGIVARTLVKKDLSFGRYIVSELSEVRIQHLQSTFDDPKIQIAQVDVENLNPEWPDRPIDAVIMVALIEHLVDPIRALTNVYKILKPGGFVYIDTPNIAKYSRRIKLFLGRFPSTASKNEGLTTYDGHPVDLFDEGHFHYFTYRSLEQLLIKFCGFARVKRLGYFQGKLISSTVDNFLARSWPSLFSELSLIAYK